MRSSDATISEFGRFVYEKVFSYYTLKQWGSRTVPDSVLDRVPVKICYQHGYFDDRYIYQPVNPLSQTTMVRIHPRPPITGT